MKDINEEIKKLGRGIGSESRYRILESLLKGPQTVGDIVKKVKISQPAVSQHLTTLKSCGFVDYQKIGQQVYYAIDVKHSLKILRHLVMVFSKCKNSSKKTTEKI